MSIAAGLLHSVLVTSDGTVTTLGLTGGNAEAPDNAHVASAAAGDDFSSALRREGDPAVAWVAPARLTAPAGARVILRSSVLMMGQPSYQWKRDGEAIPGATSAHLELTGVSASDTGDYTVEVSNASGVLESAPSRLSVGGAEAVVGYFPGYEALGEDWGATAWFGRFAHAHFPWIYHESHGWLWCHGWGGHSLHLYEAESGSWLWTSPSAYPFVHDLEEGAWVQVLE